MKSLTTHIRNQCGCECAQKPIQECAALGCDAVQEHKMVVVVGKGFPLHVTCCRD